MQKLKIRSIQIRANRFKNQIKLTEMVIIKKRTPKLDPFAEIVIINTLRKTRTNL